MRGKIYSLKEKEVVKKMILDGKSYREITNFLDIPKSTISTWFGKTIKKPITRKAMLEHLANIRKSAVIAIKNKWKKKREQEIKIIQEKIKKEILDYPLENLGFHKSLLAMLYWAEGSKGEKEITGFVNTDPNLSHLYITLLRKCYNIDESRFAIWLRVHYYHSKKKTKKFWSELLNVPQNQFYKISIKKRGKTKRFRKNFAGICAIRYKDKNIKRELLYLGRSLEKIITSSAPVAQRIERKIADFEVAGSSPAGRTVDPKLYRAKFIKA